MKKLYLDPNYPHILHGCDYNPDQWQDYPDILAEDMRLMGLANCNEMTLGIFAWASLEPEDGKYNFSFLDRAMDDIYKNGGRVVLATPSGARPQWLAQKYPEVLRTNSRFEKEHFGARHNHCYTAPIYREKTAEINRRLAQRYADHPALIAWHLSNEYGGECYCPMCQQAFRSWLKDKYGTLDELNHQWWTHFWAHRYTDWQQIEPPSPMGETSIHGLNLDWKRFVTHQTTDFMKNEIAALRQFSTAPVTTNMMCFYNGLNYRVLAKELDIASNDTYPMWRGSEADDIATAKSFAMVHDLMRSLKQRPFMLMESTPSHVNWQPYNKLKRPSMHELASLQAVAHGADTVQYFQWRKSRGSAEKLHGAVVDHVGHENTRVFREVSSLGARLKKLDEIVGTVTQAKAAIFYDWSNHWALDDAQGFCRDDKKLMQTLESFYSPLWEMGIDTDIIGCDDDFGRYSVIIAPMLYMVGAKLEAKLAEYVRCGGTLLCTYMTGMVGENDLCHLGGTPVGELRRVFGIWIEEIDTLYPGETNRVRLNDGSSATAIDYCEVIHAEGAQVLTHYDSDFYCGGPACTRNEYGLGRAYYVAFRDGGDYTDRLVREIVAEAGITSGFDGALPAGITAHTRTDGVAQYVFVQNFTHSEQTVSTQKQWTRVEDGSAVSGELALKPLETVILKG